MPILQCCGAPKNINCAQFLAAETIKDVRLMWFTCLIQQRTMSHTTLGGASVFTASGLAWLPLTR